MTPALVEMGRFVRSGIEACWLDITAHFAPSRQIGVFSFPGPGSSCEAFLRPERVALKCREISVIVLWLGSRTILGDAVLARLGGTVARTSSATSSLGGLHRDGYTYLPRRPWGRVPVA